MDAAHSPPVALTTARLVIRPYVADDIEPMAEMFADAEVTAHTLLGQRTRAETEAVLAEYMGFLAAHGYGMYAILDRADGRFLGEAGTFVAPMGVIALRYALARAGWGRGIATEASVAIVDDLFARTTHDRLVAGVKHENAASVRVMAKLGFAFEQDVTTHGATFGLFGVSRAEWTARRSQVR